jgi:hypothetical protein
MFTVCDVNRCRVAFEKGIIVGRRAKRQLNKYSVDNVISQMLLTQMAGY